MQKYLPVYSKKIVDNASVKEFLISNSKFNKN